MKNTVGKLLRQAYKHKQFPLLDHLVELWGNMAYFWIDNPIFMLGEVAWLIKGYFILNTDCGMTFLPNPHVLK